MATQPCKGCDKVISRIAANCPHCGRYSPNRLVFLVIRLLMFAIVALHIFVLRMP